MLYLIGLGLNYDAISEHGLAIAKKCKKVYLENYTVDFPYGLGKIQELIGKKVLMADREKVESLSLIDEAKKLDIALLVYGSPLTATTHMTLIDECKKSGIKYKVIYNASVFDAIAETGLQLYKFGKIASMPAWKPSFRPTSFMEIIKENQSIKAHSLLLIDIGLNIKDAIEQLVEASKEHEIKLEKILICQALGTKYKTILYKSIEECKKLDGVRKPYCIIIPSKLHFTEKEFLQGFN